MDSTDPRPRRQLLRGAVGLTALGTFGQVNSQQGGSVHTVALPDDDLFSPGVVQIAPGDMVQFVVRDDEVHTATLYHPDNGSSLRAPPGVEAWDSGDLFPGQTFAITLNQPGVHDYYCSPHHAEGMVGSIIVGNDANPDQPGLSAPTDVPGDAVERHRRLNAQARSMLGIDDGTGGGGGGFPGDDDGFEDDDEFEDDDDGFDDDIGRGGDGGTGGGGNDGTGGGDAGVAQTISMIDERFSPLVAQVDVGDTVQFVARGDDIHTATLYHPDNGSSLRAPQGVEAFDSGDLFFGQTFEVTLDQPGVYDYYCSPHHGEGMVGSIVVGNDADPNQPGLSAPTDVPPGAVRRVQQMNSQARSVLGIDDGTGGGGGGRPGGGGLPGDDDGFDDDDEFEDDDDGFDDDTSSTDDSSDGGFFDGLFDFF